MKHFGSKSFICIKHEAKCVCVHTCTHQSKPKMFSYKTNSLLRRDLEHLAKWRLMTKPLKNHGCPLLTKVIFSERKRKSRRRAR